MNCAGADDAAQSGGESCNMSSAVAYAANQEAYQRIKQETVKAYYAMKKAAEEANKDVQLSGEQYAQISRDLMLIACKSNLIFGDIRKKSNLHNNVRTGR